ncbi:rhodanese-like domain-containing protein [Georgenia sp. SYP-B2076]|uniref:rhodanese-like domain-containing protein n=1 Tax=Georgenia sp. SYP-B2076 TaxID=2495881 RepID=UPI001F0BEBAE|nr:rhodanese-like domain-containing protein [Georgenia sp. SYP-B2076]
MKRLEPRELIAAVAAGTLLVDTRTESQRGKQGELPGALVIDRTVLEWRLDSACVADPRGHQLRPAGRGGLPPRYSSSLAVASLRAVGLHRATDLIGWVQAWRAAGLPVSRGPADVRP